MKMKKYLVTTLLLIAVGFMQPLFAQNEERDITPQKGWYIGLEGGPTFGTSTFRSYSDRGIVTKGDLGFLFGYRFSPLFSMDINVTSGIVGTRAMSCCAPYWLSIDGVTASHALNCPNPDTYWSYGDLIAKTSMFHLLWHGNVDLLYLITGNGNSGCRIDLSPVLGAINSSTLMTGDLVNGVYHEKMYDYQWHFAYGGQLSAGVTLNYNLEARMYIGAAFLTGKRFDNIPKWEHTENLIYNGGLKLIWNFGKSKKVENFTVIDNHQEQDYSDELAAQANNLKTIQEQLADLQAALDNANENQNVEQPNKPNINSALVCYPFSIYFKLGSAQINSANDIENIKAFANFAKENNLSVRLRGTADKGTGSVALNQELSERRCQSVRNELVHFGLPTERINIEAAGGVTESSNAESDRRVLLDFVR